MQRCLLPSCRDEEREIRLFGYRNTVGLLKVAIIDLPRFRNGVTDSKRMFWGNGI